MAAEESLEFRIRMAILGDKAGATRSAEEIGEALRRVYDEFAAEMLRKEPAGDQQALQGVLARIQQLINEAYKVAAGPGFIGAAVDQQRAQKAAGQTDKSQAAAREAARANRETAAGEQSRAVGGMSQAVSIAHQEVDDNLLTAQREYNALLQRKIGLGTAYASAVAEGRVLQDKLNNNILAQQIALGGADEIARGKQLQAQMNRLVLEQLASSGAYADELAQAKTLQAQINNQVLTKQLTNGYAQTQAQGTALQAQLNTQTLRLLSAFPGYAEDLAEAKLLQQQVNNQVLREQLGTDYANEMAEGKVLQAQVNNEVLRQQLGTDYAREQAEGKRLQARVNNEVLREQLTNGYVDEQVEAKALQQRVNNEVLRQQLGTNYAEEQAEGKLLQQQLNTKMRQELAKTGYGTEQGRSDVADRRIKTERNQFLSSDPDALDAFAEGSRADARLKAERSKLLAADGAYIQAQGEATAAKKLESALSKQAAMRQPNYLAALDTEIANTVALAAAKKKAELDYRSSVAGARTIVGGEEAKARLANSDMVAAQYRRVVQIRQLLGIQQSQIVVQRDQVEEAIRGVGLEKTINALQQEEIAMRRAAIAAGRGGILPPGGPKDPGDPTAPGPSSPGRPRGFNIGGAFLTTARYAASSAILYGATREISEAVRETVELEKILNQVERQFANMGERGAAEFARFKTAVFDIAQLTGENADNVAQLGLQMQGAFGGDTSRALEETRSAIMAVRVTGLELTETIDAFTALTQSFEGVENAAGDTRLTIMDFSDVAIQLQENLGVLAKETISFSADLAPVAAELGFTADQLAVLGAVSQKYSGRSGASLAEAYGRILPQIRESGVEISMIFSTLGQGIADDLNKAFAQGDIEKAFMTIIGNYNRLAKQQQGAVIDLLGGRREAAAIIPMLRNGQEAVSEFGRAMEAEGKTVQYFNDLQDTLQQRLARLDESWKHMIHTLFESGLKDFFADLVGVVDSLVSGLGLLVDVLHGVAGVADALHISGGISALAEMAFLIGGARMARRGVSSIRGAFAGGGGELVEEAVATGPKAHTLRAGAAAFSAHRATGAGVARALGAGVLAGPWAAVGIAGATILTSSWSQGVKEAASKAAAEIAHGGISGGEMRAMQESLGIQGSLRETIENRLRAGDTGEEIAEALGNVAEKTASGWEQALDKLPWEASKVISANQAQIDEIVRSIVEDFDASLSAAIDAYSGGSEETRGQTDQAVKDLIAERLDQIEQATRIDSDALNAVAGAVENEWMQANLGIGPDATLGEVLAAQQRLVEQGLADMYGLPPEAVEALNQAINEFGEDARVAAALIEQGGDNPEIAQVSERIRQAIADNNLVEELNALHGEKDKFEDSTNAFVISIIDLLEDTPALGPLEAAYQEGIMQFEEASARYDAGILSLNRYEDAMKHYIETLKSQSGASAETDIELANALDTRRTHIMSLIESEAGVLSELADLGGGPGAYDEIARVYETGLGNAELSISQRAEVARSLIDNMKAKQQYLADIASSEEESDRLLTQRLTLPSEVRGALIADLVNSNVEFQRAMGVFTQGNRVVAEELTQEIVNASMATGQSLQTVAVGILTDHRNIEIAAARARIVTRNLVLATKRLTAKIFGGTTALIMDTVRATVENAKDLATIAQLSSTDPVTEALGGILAEVPTSIVPGSVTAGGVEVEKVKEKVESTAKEIAEAWLNVQEAQIAGDPLAEAKIAQQRAAVAARYAENEAERINAIADRIRADRQVTEALQAIALAEVSLFEAKFANDPYQVALAAQKRAGMEVDYARGRAERLEAMAAKVVADRAVQEAIWDISDAQVQLLIAMADAAGNTVESARLAVRAVEDEINQARARGAGQAEMLSLEAQRIAAKASERDAVLSDRQEFYAYLHDMEKITTGQLINYLQSLMAIPDLTDKQIRDIELQIKGLRDELGQDFQFNLPANLALPTAYEVRRFNQSGSDGIPGGYNDNRSISVTVNAQTNADPNQIASVVATAVGEPSRNGTSIRRYP